MNITIDFKPKDVIIVEGIFALDGTTCDMMDVKIYADTDADLRILRRLTRDTKRAGVQGLCYQSIFKCY